MNDIFDFNNLADALKNGYTDADIAKAFTASLNNAKAADDKRRADEANQELDKKKRWDKAKTAADALNDFLRYEGILGEKDAAFAAKDIIEFVEEAKEVTAPLIKALKKLDPTSVSTTAVKCKPSDDTITFAELFDSLFK